MNSHVPSANGSEIPFTTTLLKLEATDGRSKEFCSPQFIQGERVRGFKYVTPDEHPPGNRCVAT